MRDFWLGMRDYRPVAAEGSSVGSNSTNSVAPCGCQTLALLSNPWAWGSNPHFK